jgi:hypothetical protein
LRGPSSIVRIAELPGGVAFSSLIQNEDPVMLIFGGLVQKPLISQRLIVSCWMSSDVSKLNLGRHGWIRTSDLFRVKVLTLGKSTTYKTPLAP